MSQADTVLNHLRKHGKITSITAIGLYGITRISAVIFKLRKLYNITSTLKPHEKGGRFAEYRLVEPKTGDDFGVEDDKSNSWA